MGPTTAVSSVDWMAGLSVVRSESCLELWWVHSSELRWDSSLGALRVDLMVDLKAQCMAAWMVWRKAQKLVADWAVLTVKSKVVLLDPASPLKMAENLVFQWVADSGSLMVVMKGTQWAGDMAALRPVSLVQSKVALMALQ